MKAKFNYDLASVKDMLAVTKNLADLHSNLDVVQASVLVADLGSGSEVSKESEVLRREEREDLMARAEALTLLMSEHREQAKGAQIHGLQAWRVQKLLKSN